MVFSMSADPRVTARLVEALRVSESDQWADILIIARTRGGDVRVTWSSDTVVALGLVQTVHIILGQHVVHQVAAPTPAPITPVTPTPTNAKGQN